VKESLPGYPKVATFLDSDENFMICRRFGYLHWRVLLDKQRELQYLEDSLSEMDTDDHNAHNGCLQGADHVISALKDEPETERLRLMRDIRKALIEYSRRGYSWTIELKLILN
jgi:hypothetical protein